MLEALGLALALGSPLRWEAPEGCPSADAVQAQLRLQLPDDLEVPPRHFVVGRAGERWQMTWLEAGNPPQVRQADAATCQELADAAVVIVLIGATASPGEPAAALAGDEAVVAEPGESTVAAAQDDEPMAEHGSEEPATAAGSTPAPNAPRDTTAGRARPDSAQGREARQSRALPAVLLGLGAGVGVGTIDATTAVFGGRIGLEGRWWSATIGGTHWLRRTLALADDASARVWLSTADLRGCGHPYSKRLVLALCGGASVGAITGRGLSVRNGRRGSSPWVALRFGAILRGWLSPHLGAFVGAEPLVIVGRPQLVVEGLGLACCSGSLGFEGTAGITARFGGRAQRESDQADIHVRAGARLAAATRR